jgi:hypothetical protein
LLCSKLFSQEHHTSTISLRVTSSVTSCQFFIEISTSSTKTNILLKTKNQHHQTSPKDGNGLKLYQQPPSFINAANTPSDTIESYIDKFDSIGLANNEFSVDSLTIINSKYPNYTKLLNNILTSSADSLQDALERTVLDGISIRMKINHKGRKSLLYSFSPTVNSNPKIYLLLTGTTNLFKTLKKNYYLNSKSTCRY